jgi:hypothetical protein
MGLQSLIVALVVAGSFVYAAWRLMPAALRRWLASQLLRLPVPERLLAPLHKAAQTSGGCDCSGCDRAPGQRNKGQPLAHKGLSLAQPLVFMPRKKR